ncbi:MAG: LPS export ABC transporter periplasmic protein LptC [bacterium]|nr:LPS export ABC transporter periplasmic protein LptC [Gammaproteobacteria bacterium]HIL98674.1 LPS export ABC transporter periplasmic protein LptC [Pseudomonadales bacterium]
MLTSRTIILFCLILLFAAITNLMIDQADDPDTNPAFARNDPDLYMLNADITQFSETGVPQHNIRAERLTHFPLTDITTLKTPNMTLYSDQENSLPWEIAAENGRLLPEVQVREQIVELWDHVLAIQERKTGDFVNIRTESLTVYPDREYAETNQNVTINDKSGRTLAGGMQAFFGQERFIFYAYKEQRVHTVLSPTFE